MRDKEGVAALLPVCMILPCMHLTCDDIYMKWPACVVCQCSAHQLGWCLRLAAKDKQTCSHVPPT